jgi:hypothetical protein
MNSSRSEDGAGMATQIRFGQIVWVEIADANGIVKARPAIIVTPNDRITPSGSLEVVAVTSFLPDPLPDDHVLLPWHAQGHPRTGLNRKSAAVCSWQARISATAIQSVAGIVPGSILIEIMSRVASAGEEKV